MAIIKSLIFGDEGSYNIFGIPVVFKKAPTSDDQDVFITQLIDNFAKKHLFVSRLINAIGLSNIVRVLDQGPAHVAVHEMSHALSGCVEKFNNCI
jgi:hypothetical protein